MAPRLKVWVAGSRSWDNPKPIYIVLKRIVEARTRHGFVVCNGGAPGVDKLSTAVCRKLGVPVFENMAQWDVFNRVAGPKRNALIIEIFEPDLLVAFHYKPLADHRGTWNAVAQAHDAGITVKQVQVKLGVAMPSSVSKEAPGSQARRDAKRKKSRGWPGQARLKPAWDA